MWLVTPCDESAVDHTPAIKQDVDDLSSDWSIYLPPLPDCVVPEIKEYEQVQMEEACAGTEWEECSGGCGVQLKAGRWGVCDRCYRTGVPARVHACEPGRIPCRGCGVHVKASVGICKPCAKKENTVPAYGQSPPVRKRENRWARSAARVQQLVNSFQLEPGGRRASGAWVYYPDGYEANPIDFYGKQFEGAFLVDSFSQFYADARHGIITWTGCCCMCISVCGWLCFNKSFRCGTSARRC